MTNADKKLSIFSGLIDAATVVYILLLHSYNQILNDVPGANFAEQAWNIMCMKESWRYLFGGLIIAGFLGWQLIRILKHWSEYNLILIACLLVIALILIVFFILTYSNPLFRAAAVVAISTAALIGVFR